MNKDTIEMGEQEQRSAPSQVQRKLTKKQKAFIREYKNNPTESNTEIASRVYNVANRDVARSIASENMAKPSIISHLAKYSDEIEETIGTVSKELVASDKLESKKEGLLNMRWIHDKVHGKATQRTEVTTQGIVISVDLNGSIT